MTRRESSTLMWGAVFVVTLAMYAVAVTTAVGYAVAVSEEIKQTEAER